MAPLTVGPGGPPLSREYPQVGDPTGDKQVGLPRVRRWRLRSSGVDRIGQKFDKKIKGRREKDYHYFSVDSGTEVQISGSGSQFHIHNSVQSIALPGCFGVGGRLVSSSQKSLNFWKWEFCQSEHLLAKPSLSFRDVETALRKPISQRS